MRLGHLVARGFRNLADLECALPPSGVVLLGANAQGKTNLLEAIYYPVLFRSFRGAPDQEVGRFDGPGFQVEASLDDPRPRTLSATYGAQAGASASSSMAKSPRGWQMRSAPGSRSRFSRTTWDSPPVPPPRGEGYLDRLLSLADRQYLRWLARYRAALAQRNSALRQGRPEVARAFDAPLAEAGAAVVRTRQRWAAERRASSSRAEFDCLGEGAGATPALPGTREARRPGGMGRRAQPRRCRVTRPGA